MRTHLALVALLAGFTVLAAAYLLVMPPFEGPDAGGHFGYVAYLRARPCIPPLDAGTCGDSHELVQQPPLYYALAALATAGHPLTPTRALYVVNPHYGDLGYRVTATPPGDPGPALRPLRIMAALSLLGGLLAVLATWFLARALLPGERGLALAAAAAVGLNPQFLAASATITNDTWAAATFAWTIVCAVRALRAECAARDGCPARTRVWRWGVVGALAGLAALTKYGNLTVLVVLAVLLVVHARRAGARRALTAALAVGATMALVAGWWYAVQAARYGSPVPVARMLELLPDLARDEPAGLGTLWREATWLPYSYWGVFGHGAVAPGAYFAVVFGLLLAAAVGLVVRVGEALRGPDRPTLAAGSLLALWFGVVFAGLLGWMRVMHQGNHGRLLFAAAPAAGMLLAWGWSGLAPRRRRSAVLAGAAVAMVVLAVWGLAVVRRAYAIPAALDPLPAMDRAVAGDFDGGMTVVGADLPRGGAVPGGGELPVTLYLTARTEIGGFFRMFLHLAETSDRRLAGYDGDPAVGRHPTRQWVPGELFADRLVLRAEDVPTDTLATLTLGFYEDETGKRRAVLDAAGRPVGDRVDIGPVRVMRDPPGPAFTGRPVAEWAGGIVLATAEVEMTDGVPAVVAATWQARAPIHRDYTVFAQLLDREGRLVAQVDRQPRDGASPTSTWVPGYAVADTYRFDVLPATWDRLILGLYDAAGTRLPVVDVLPGAPADHVVLSRRAP